MAETYDVTNQAPTQAHVPGGSFQPAIEITFVTKPSGIVGRATVPEAVYTVDEVDKVLTAKAQALESVHAL